MNSRDQFIIGEQIKQQECPVNIQQAKQIATVKWLLQKAYDNNVPEKLKEPFYYDQYQQQQNVPMGGKNCSFHLKPPIVYSLANAELYCLALANIYLDPNFHTLNHTGIIQALARKGVTLSDPQLTETVLLQTNPLKLTAHLCVIEAIMVLYAKEIATPDRVFAAIRKFNIPPQQRFNNDFNSNSVIQQWNVSDYDQLLFLWISEAVSALNERIKQSQSEDIPDSEKTMSEIFKTPGRELTELCDGVALCALVSFYCPQSLPWKIIRIGKPTNTADCIHNLNLFSNFCQSCLPYQIFHMLPQDILPHSISLMRPNVMALLADMFNLLEIHPVSSSAIHSENELRISDKSESAYTRKSGHSALQKRSLTTTQQICAIPNLRNYPNAQSGGFNSDTRTSNSSPKLDRKSRNNSVSDQNNVEVFVVHRGRNIPTLSSVNPESNLKEKQSEPVAAGKPSNWNDSRNKNQLTGCGRRSRRNSFSDESQLTIENFGGSHENINLLGRNPDKEPAIHIANPASDDNSESNEIRQLRCQVAAQENRSSAAITSLLCDNAVEKSSPTRTFINATVDSPSTTISSVSSASSTAPTVETAEMLESCKVSSQMLNIRLKLEEKRRQIENEKRRMELNLKKQRQKLNKAAFLQAVSKIENEQTDNYNSTDNVNSSNIHNTGDGDGDGSGNCGDGYDGSNNSDLDDADNDSIVTYEDISQVEERWLKNEISKDINGDSPLKFDGQISESENIDIEKCQKSISEMDSNLHAIQTDLQWLTFKEKEMLQNPISTAHADLGNTYPGSVSLHSESQVQNPIIAKNMLHSNQNNQSNYINMTGYNVDDGRGTFATLPNKNFADFAYTDNYSPHPPQNQRFHHSLLSTVPLKSPLASPHSPMTTFDNVNYSKDNYYVNYGQQQHPQPPQQQPLVLHTQMSPNYNYSFHSMNAVDNDGRNFGRPNIYAPDDKENRVHSPQVNEQFYLHKPSEMSPFHVQTSSSPNVNLSSITNSTFAVRKIWDNRENLANLSPQPTPSPRTFTSRFPSKETTSLSKAFTENKLKTGLGTSKFSNDNAVSNHNSNTSSIGLTSLRKNYSPHDDLEELNRYNNSEVDACPRRSNVGSHSIPTPSADDMEPQCISFIGSQSDDGKTNVNEFNDSVNKLNIINGNRTYRIPSPTNKPHSRPSGNYPFMNEENSKNGKGFYVSLSHDDDENSKDGDGRLGEKNIIKPPFRTRRFNSGNSISSRNEKLKNGSIKKPEVPKKPETIYNDRSESNESRLQDGTGNRSDNQVTENHSDNTIVIKRKSSSAPSTAVGLVINADTNTNDPALVDEMERKKERILLQSLQRRQQQEEMKARKEIELQRRKEQEKQKEEQKARKKEEEKRRRAMILEKHRLKKLIEEAEREGKPIDKELLNAAMMNTSMKSNVMNGESSPGNVPLPKLRSKKSPFGTRPRPKTIHIDVGSNLKENNSGSNLLSSNFSKKGSAANLAEHNNNYGMSRRDYYRGSQDCLVAGPDVINTAGTSASSIYSDLTDEDRAVSATYHVNGPSCGSIGRRRGSSYKTSRDVSLDRGTSRIARPKFSSYYQSYPRKSSSLMNLCGSSCDQDSFTYNSRYMTDTDSGLGRATPPHRTSSPAPNNSSSSGPGSLPPSHHSRRLRYDDTASESGGSEYSGLRLYKQPAVKSNRGIIMNAIEYCVFPGEVNRNAKNRILEEISRSDATNTKHFLVLFRDARCQFRALYSYFPENEEVTKVYGTGPKQVTEKMFDKFFKYNSGGKCFTQVHTKHLTVTIDAFTIHNSLWQGKKVNLPNKRDMTLVI